MVIPSITILCFDSIETSVELVTTENETEEKKLDSKIFESPDTFIMLNLPLSSTLIGSLNKNYQSIHIADFNPPPEA
jgi:hypothetical protein